MFNSASQGEHHFRGLKNPDVIIKECINCIMLNQKKNASIVYCSVQRKYEDVTVLFSVDVFYIDEHKLCLKITLG